MGNIYPPSDIFVKKIIMEKSRISILAILEIHSQVGFMSRLVSKVLNGKYVFGKYYQKLEFFKCVYV